MEVFYRATAELFKLEIKMIARVEAEIKTLMLKGIID
jgi:hypothetical protein